MDLLYWTVAYSVGIKEIDDQHKRIFDVINRLYLAMKESKVKDELDSILKELVDYSVYHFTTEENYFDKFNYLEKEAHKLKHKFYKDKVNEFVNAYKNNDNFLPFKLAEFLEKWWYNHIALDDKKYFQCFHEHGLC